MIKYHFYNLQLEYQIINASWREGESVLLFKTPARRVFLWSGCNSHSCLFVWLVDVQLFLPFVTLITTAILPCSSVKILSPFKSYTSRHQLSYWPIYNCCHSYIAHTGTDWSLMLQDHLHNMYFGTQKHHFGYTMHIIIFMLAFIDT